MPENNELEQLRAEIDRIDAELVALLNRRYMAVEKIGAYKRRHGLPVAHPERERQLLARLCGLNAGPMPPETLRAIYAAIIAGAHDIENTGR